MNWVRQRFFCLAQMSNSDFQFNLDKDEDANFFSKEEETKICRWLHISNNNEISRLKPYHFKVGWKYMITEGLYSFWIDLIYSEGPDQTENLWEKLYWILIKQWKASSYDRALVLKAILEPDKDFIKTGKLIEYINNVVNSLEKIIKYCGSTEYNNWITNSKKSNANRVDLLREFLVKNLTNKESMDLKTLSEWIESNIVLKDILAEVCCMSASLKPPERKLLPTPMSESEWYSFVTLGQLIFISSHLDQDDTAEWRLLFSKDVNGGSLKNFARRTKNKGSTIIMVQDENFNIFGAFASQSWISQNKFYGDKKSFLFTLSPKLNIFKASDYNANYQYFYIEEKPGIRGLGFGGSIENFGIMFEEDLEFGLCSNKCSTYDNYTMPTSMQKFKIKEFQVWATQNQCDCNLNKDSESSLEICLSCNMMYQKKILNKFASK